MTRVSSRCSCCIGKTKTCHLISLRRGGRNGLFFKKHSHLTVFKNFLLLLSFVRLRQHEPSALPLVGESHALTIIGYQYYVNMCMSGRYTGEFKSHEHLETHAKSSRPYGVAPRKLTQCTRKRLAQFGMRCNKPILRLSWIYRVTNSDVQKRIRKTRFEGIENAKIELF